MRDNDAPCRPNNQPSQITRPWGGGRRATSPPKKNLMSALKKNALKVVAVQGTLIEAKKKQVRERESKERSCSCRKEGNVDCCC